MNWLENLTIGTKLVIAWGGVVATPLIAWLGNAVAGDPLDGKLFDYGMAGICIIFLLYALRITRAELTTTRNELTAELAAERAKREAMEKSIREGLQADLQKAHHSRERMISLMEKNDRRCEDPLRKGD